MRFASQNLRTSILGGGAKQGRRLFLWVGIVAVCWLSGFQAGTLAKARLDRLAYDDANYLERGLYHARQIAHRPAWQWPVRLLYSLTFEGPKPPFFYGWLAASALLFGGNEHFEPWVAFAVGVPWGLLCLLLVSTVRTLRVSSAWVALLSLHGMPGLVALMPLAMVEVWLAVWLLAALLALEGWLDRPSPLRASALGLSLGFAFLTKLTAGMFLAPALAAAVFLGYRRNGLSSKHVGTALWVLCFAALVAAPWYGIWAPRAWEFAKWGSSYEACALSQPWWIRTAELPLEVLGFPLLVVGGLLCWKAAGRLSAGEKFRLFTWLAASLPALLLVASRPVSEMRYLAPGLAWFPLLLALCWEKLRAERSRASLRVVSTAVMLLLAVSTARSLTRAWEEASGRGSHPLQLASFLKAEIAPKALQGVLCNLGSIPLWNPYRLRLGLELAGLGRNLQVVDLTQQPDPQVLTARCDVVFRLRAEEIPQAQPEQVANRALLQAGELPFAAAGFELLSQEHRPAGLFLPSEVWLRVKR